MVGTSTSKNAATENRPKRVSRAHNKERSSGLNHRGTETRNAIVAVTREQIRTNGLSLTTVGTVTAELDIPRPLFYHYFKNIDSVAEVVLLNEVNSYLDSVREWDTQRTSNNIDDIVDSAIASWRKLHSEGNLFYQASHLAGNAEIYTKFMRQIVDRVARYVMEILIPDLASTLPILSEKYPDGIPMVGLYELLYAMIYGINSLLLNAPETSNNMIKHLLARGLEIEQLLTFEDNDGWNEPLARP